MGRAISEVLPFAVGVAISPVPIIAVILVLFSPRKRVNGPMFLAGWVVGLAVVVTVVYAIADAGNVSGDQGASDTTSWIKLVLGVLLVAGAARRWRTRPPAGVDAPMPQWMTAIDDLSPVKAIGIGVVLAAVNPKNLALEIGAAASVAQAGVTTGDAAVALAVFVVLASLTIATPVIVALAGGARASAMLDGWKAWLSANNTAVMAVLFAVFGVVLFSQGVRGLTA